MSLTIACRGLLFDADGVLVDSDVSVEVSWTRWALQWHLDPADVLSTVHGRRSTDTVGLLIDPALQREALADIDRYEIEDAAAVTACPGAAELLGTLPAGSWAIVTSGTRKLATARLAAAGLPTPQVFVTAENVPQGKPHPAGYRQAAASLGVPIQDCVVLEDSLSGAAAGLAAGATVVGVTPRAMGSGAAVVLRDLTGLRWSDDALLIPAAVTLDHR